MIMPREIQTPIKQIIFCFAKSGFQTPGLVPLDSSRNFVLFRGIYVFELRYAPGSNKNRFGDTPFQQKKLQVRRNRAGYYHFEDRVINLF